jgi:DNA replication protein DnaC
MLPTFISSNKNIEQLGQSFDARVASRLRTAVVIEMTGQDRRLDVARKDKARIEGSEDISP